MNPLQTLIAMFIEPGKAFGAVRERSMIWLPLLASIIGMALIWVWYYQRVDFPWLVDHLASANPDLSSPAQREAFEKFMTPKTLTWSSVIGSAVGFPIIAALVALYFLLAAKVMNLDIGFGKWFGFACWSSVPSLLLIPIMAIQLLMNSNGQIGPEQMNPTSLNALIFHFDIANPWTSLLNSISAVMIWSLVLSVIGFKLWSGRSTGKSAFVVLLPYILIYAGWIAKITLSHSA